MPFDDWDAPYTSPLRGCLMLGWKAVTVLAIGAGIFALLLIRAAVIEVVS